MDQESKPFLHILHRLSASQLRCGPRSAGPSCGKSPTAPRRNWRPRPRRCANQLHAEGYDTGHSESHIIPLLLGDPARALQLSQRLMELGVLVPAIRPHRRFHQDDRCCGSASAGTTGCRHAAGLVGTRSRLPVPSSRLRRAVPDAQWSTVGPKLGRGLPDAKLQSPTPRSSSNACKISSVSWRSCVVSWSQKSSAF